MSGGYFNYFYMRLDEMAVRMEDPELEAMVADLAKVLHDLEWWKDDDISEEQYRKTVNAFKNKWLRGQPTKRLKQIIDKEMEAKKLELYQMIGIK